MKAVKNMLAVFVTLSMVFSAPGFSDEIKEWEDVVDSHQALGIYIGDIVNSSANTTVDAATITKIVKDVFAKRINPPFNVVQDKAKADLVFSGAITEYVWQLRAPITDVYGAGPLVLDVATARGKNYARMQIDYTISLAGTGEAILDQHTIVTLKRRGMPEEKSYGMIYDRTPKILSMDLFKRYKGKRHDR